MSEIYEVEDVGYNHSRGWCIHCETCKDDEIEPHESFESGGYDKCFVCHNRRCLHSFSRYEIVKDDNGEWHCPNCYSASILQHERCQCDVATASGTIYQVHDEDGYANSWPTYHHNGDKKVFECTRCGGQFNISLKDTTEDTEGGHKAKRCSFCKELMVKNVRWQDRIPTPFIEFFDDGPIPTNSF